MKLRSHLLLLVLAVALPIGAVAAWTLQQVLEAEREAQHERVLESTRLIAVEIDKDLTEAQALLTMLAAAPALQQEDWTALRRQAAAAAKAEDVWLVVFDQRGRQMLNTRVPPGESLPDRPQPQDVAALARATGASVSSLFVGPNTGKRVLRVDVPAVGAQGQRYLVSAAFDAAYFSRLIQRSRLPSTWLVAVFDQNGVTVARSHRAEEFVGKPGGQGILQAARSAPEGRVRTVTREGIALYDTYVRIPRTGWIVANGVPAQEFEGRSRDAVWTLSAAFAAALAAAALLALLLGTKLTRAFARVAAVVAGIGAGERPVAASRIVTELDDIQDSAILAHDRLVAERQARQQAEAERERLYELEQAHRRRAEAENAGKDQFLAMLGHELRNPLSAIRGAISVVRRQGPKADHSFAHDVIDRQARHLSRIVEDLVEVNRVLRGKIVLHLEPLPLAELVDSVLASFEAAGRFEGRQLVRQVAPVWVRADRSRLEQVLANLLSNAAKFSSPGGRIEVTVRPDAGHAVLTVADDGVGMSPDLMARAFDVFVQGPTAIDRPQGGLGIGLALVRQLVTDHGGTVEAFSDGEGRGARFTVSLPAIDAPDAQDRAEAPASSRTPCRLLVVDDQADARETLARLLEMEGHEVERATDGEEALRQASERQFDAAVIDIGMPGLDGYEVARRLRLQAAGHPLRLIALTGYGQPSDVAAAADAGFDVHLTKPVDPQRLLPLIDELCADRARAGAGDPKDEREAPAGDAPSG